jgi:hypothetical protein
MLVTALNDLGLKCNELHFLNCQVEFRQAIQLPNPSCVRLSELTGIRLGFIAQEVICYADNILQPCLCVPLPSPKEPAQITEPEKEDMDLEDVFAQYDMAERPEAEEDMENLYQHDRLVWVRQHCKCAQTRRAVEMGYDCQEQYGLERLAHEFPGFHLIDHTTILYKAKYPSSIAMDTEARFNKMLSGYNAKYGTYIRAGLLESHRGINYNDEEIIVIYNYLWKFDVFAPLRLVCEMLEGK